MRTSGVRRALLGAVVTMVAGVSAVAPAGATDRLELEGALHEHSGYSDGWPGSMPRDYFAAGAAAGLDFMGSADHSDNVATPQTLSGYCVEDIAYCLVADKVDRADSYRKWAATLEQADLASTPTFTAFRGFEWTSDVYGHVNVFFSSNVTNAKQDGGTPDLLYKWLNKPAAAGGGDDGIAVFNHPGAKGRTGSPDLNWLDFAYRHDVDDKVVGLETFNDQTDYGSAGAKGNPPPEGWYAHALDRGWHLGAVGGEDLGHDKADDWGGPERAKTIILATDRSRAAIKSAMVERRFYAIRRRGIRLTFTVDGKPMGTRYDAAPGTPLHVDATVAAPAEGDDLHLDLVTSGGEVVATGDETLSADVTASAAQRYYYVRARRGADTPGEPIAYSSPVWTTTALAPETYPPLPDPPAAAPGPEAGPAPVPVPAPVPHPPAAPKPAAPGKTSIRTASTVRLDSKGRLAVPLRCVGETSCRTATKLTARIDRRTRTIGTAGRTTISAGQTKNVRVTLSKNARRLISRSGKLKVTVSAGGKRKTVTVKKKKTKR